MVKMIVDATNAIAGRLASVVAKKALLGENIVVVNSEKAVISGNKRWIIEKFKERRLRGHPYKGPFYPSKPDRVLRRMIRGMLPRKTARGRAAFKRVMCYVGVPDEFKDKKSVKIKEADASKLKTIKFIKLGDLCKEIGWKGK